ncbi:MAG: MalY/PatB family protein [Prevotella sp.]
MERKFDFDKLVERRGTGALKTDALQERYGDAGLLPLWVADMDFEVAPCITEAMMRRMSHPVFGYTVTPDTMWQSVRQWLFSHHGWRVEREWLTFVPGIVKGIGMAINVFVAPDEKVIIQPPVYHPFRLTAQGDGRTVVMNRVRETPDGSYEMDFDNLEAVTDGKCRLLVLSNPHNPGGVMWSADTLRRLAAFCHERGIIVLSDEIHCDIALWGNRHVPFATVSDEAAACSITFGAPSKTFNIAGIVSSYAIVPDEGLRSRLFSWMTANELDEPTLFAPIATEAAFTYGEPWRREMVAYVEDNIRYVEDFCREHLPEIKPWRPQASFLVWLDCRALGLAHDALVSLFVKTARLALNDGEMFGEEGAGFMRLNVGCPRSVVEEALRRLEKAIHSPAGISSGAIT